MQEWVLGSHKSSGGMIHHPRTRGNERRRPTGAAEGESIGTGQSEDCYCELRRIPIPRTSVNKGRGRRPFLRMTAPVCLDALALLVHVSNFGQVGTTDDRGGYLFFSEVDTQVQQ